MNKILFIVEGIRDRDYVKSIINEMGLKATVFPVCANIHMLYAKLEKDEFQLNIVDTLLEMNGIAQADKDMLKEEAPFTYTYLLFDMDPQHYSLPIDDNIRNIERMLEFFTDETDNTIGKLYINYPMLESLWDYPKDKMEEYKERVVSIGDLKKYKTIVNSRGRALDWKDYSLRLYKALGLINVKKANYIVNEEWDKPSYSSYLSDLSQSSILLSEKALIHADGVISTLNSIPLFMIDYWGNVNGFYDSL